MSRTADEYMRRERVVRLGGGGEETRGGTRREEDLQNVLAEVTVVKGQQDSLTSRLENLKMYTASFALPLQRPFCD